MSTVCIGKTIDLPAQRLDYDPVKGETLAEVFEGTLEACFSKAIAVRNQRPDLAFNLESADGPLWRITVRSPDFGSDPGLSSVDTWELLGNDIQKDIYEAPFTLNIDTGQLDIVREAMSEEQTVADVQEDLDDEALLLLVLLKKGTTHFQVSQYVLRYTQLVSSKSQVRASFSNVERVYVVTNAAGQAAFATLIGLPPELLFSLEQIPVPVIVNSASSVLLNTEIYHTGWMKKTPTVSQVSGNRFQITQEYWLDYWVKALYPAAS